MKLNRKLVLSLSTFALLAPLVLQANGQRPAIPAKVQKTGPSTPTPAQATPPAMTPDDVAAFLDGVVPLQLKRENIAGAVVIIVKDGKVLYAKGYGYSDVKDKKPVTVDATLFRPGSISKLFTWTAVMQLVQQGKIDLDRNVNDYLDFKIPDTYPQPITVRNLMTHTPGFEESIQDLISNNPKHLEPLGEYLKTHVPARVFPPGTTGAYSNYGAALAGYIVQRVSGIPFDEYVEKNIFQPLNMQHSTFDQPPPANLAPLMSDGYRLASGKAKPFEIVVAAPAGSLSTTADDISHFMLAHLQGGEYNGASILSPETVTQMHTRQQYGENPATNGMCLGFYEEIRNGHRIIGHGGDTMFFHSDLHLMQDENLGFFVSYNSAGKGEIDARGVLWHQFLDRYFPYTIPAALPVANAVQDAKLVAGQYRASRGSFTTIFSFTGFLGELTVDAKPDGTIVTGDMKTLDGQPRQWKEIAPLVYRSVDGQSLLAFSRNYNGRLRASVDYPFEVFDRVSFLNSKSFNMFLLFFIVAITFLALIFWPIGAWMRKHYHRPLVLSPAQRRSYVILRIVCLLDVGFFVAGICFLTAMTKNLDVASSSIDPILRLIQAIGWLGSVGTIFAILAIFDLWRAENRWWLGRIGYVLVGVACIGFSWFLFHWNLLHFSVRF
ncbi:MAG TPA: serine hydrolase domain-containing protein [Acidobacteriaceae bacterium]|nr:serine hydrolase domain-containing protein [Acidobacteriaceae bacterium]